MKYGALLLLASLLTACSELGPFIDSRREAGQLQPVGQSTPTRIAVCYNPIWHSQSQIETLAQTACPHHQITYDDTSYFNCRLTSPNTAFYLCK